MALQSAVLGFAGDAPIKIAALATSTSSAEQVLGHNCVFAINADQDITIRVGNSGMAAADATFYRIPANQQTTLYLNDAVDRIRVFNLSGTTAANVYIQKLNRF